MDDAALVQAARRGDDTAWAAIYDRYADKLHDHCHRILRDRDEAADALHDAFLAASRNLEQLRDPSRLRPWLYSICRHTSLRRLRARSRVELTDAPDELMATDTDLDRGVRGEELTELVWAAAAGLNPRDQALLDLNLRQGLEGQDLADAMGTSLSNSYVMLSRMRDQVERSLGALLIARLGREDCQELDGLLAGWDGRFSPLLRKRVARHVDGCDTCSENRSRVASPLALLAAAPLVPAPGLLKARVISSIRNVEVVDGPHVPFTKDGFAVLEAGGAERSPKAAWIVAAAAIVLLLLGVFAFRGDDGGDGSVLAAGSATSTTRARLTTGDSATIPTIPEETSTSSDLGADDGASDGTGTTVKGDKTTTTVKGGGTNTTATTKPGSSTTATTKKPFERINVSNLSISGPCPAGGGARTVVVHATVRSDSGVGFVQFSGKKMTAIGGDVYEYKTTTAGSVSGFVHASDGHGESVNSETVSVPACPAPTTSTSGTIPSTGPG
jgi:RNA polymerase sigma factor (sigma-70 family)